MIYSAAQCSTENPGLLIINGHQLFFTCGTHKVIRQRSSFLHSQCCNHHIPFSRVMSSYLQSVGDRTFCIANAHYTFCHTKGSVFNTFAESSAGLGRKRHCLCILQFWEPSYFKSDIFLSAIRWTGLIFPFLQSIATQTTKRTSPESQDSITNNDVEF